eukprot:jgi/Mesvir1/10469/Mv14379-RA.1
MQLEKQRDLEALKFELEEQISKLKRKHEDDLGAVKEDLARVKGELRDEKIARQALELELVKATCQGSGDEGRSVEKWLLMYSSAAAASDVKLPPPLLTAARTGWLDVVKHFVRFGVDLNGVDKNGDTALHLAVENNHLEVVKCLAHAGARMDIPGGGLGVPGRRLNRSWPPLHLAAAKGFEGVVETLLAAGADLNATATYDYVSGETALHIAVSKGHVKIVDVLLAARANVNAVASRGSMTGETVLHIATDEDVVKALLRVADAQLVNAVRTTSGTQRCSETALVVSVRARRWSVARLLLEAGADVNPHGTDSASVAAIVEDLETLQLMLAKGANIGVRGHCLCAAVAKGLMPAVEALLGAEEDAKVYSSEGYLENALHLATGGKKLAAVDRLLRAGADPNGLSWRLVGGTQRQVQQPLNAAVTGGDVEIVKRLVQAGATPDDALFHLAVREGNQEIVTCLVEAGCARMLESDHASA